MENKEEKVKIKEIEVRESFIRIVAECEGQLYEGLLLKRSL
jgi:hypothetical protein